MSIPKLTLSKPIMINGEEVKELPYDFEAMTARDKIKAGQKMKIAGIVSNMEEMDTDYHFFLFAEAVCKADPGIAETDVMMISAKDAHKAAALARNFFYLDSGE